MKENIEILVDSDNVIANWDKGMLDGIIKFFPMINPISQEDRNIRNIFQQYAQERGEDAVKALVYVHNQEGFYENLNLMPGAYEALQLMNQEYCVKICTQIPSNAPEEIANRIKQEKINFFRQKLGDKWVKEAILTQGSKSQVKATYLIDDCPNIGNGNQSWEQLLFDGIPYNQNYQGNLTTINWDNWQKILKNKIKNDFS